MVNGGGKNVGLVAAGNFYVSVDENEGHLFAALGYDGFPDTEDDVQIISNSWGNSGTHNDGWDYHSRSVDTILRWVNPTLSDMNSTGNGAAGYGTVTCPGATLSVGVGASTLYDSGDNFDMPVTQGPVHLQRLDELVEPRPHGPGRQRRQRAGERRLGRG